MLLLLVLLKRREAEAKRIGISQGYLTSMILFGSLRTWRASGLGTAASAACARIVLLRVQRMERKSALVHEPFLFARQLMVSPPRPQ